MPTIRIGERKVFCETGENLMQVLQKAQIPLCGACNGVGTCGKCKVRICSGNSGEASAEELKALSKKELQNGIRLACRILVEEDLSIQIPEDVKQQEKSGKVLTRGFLPEFRKDENLQGYGLALDIGTTTVVMSLICMKTGEELGQEAAMNPQRLFGHDVLSRITYESKEGASGRKQLQSSIVKEINRMIKALCDKHRISLDELTEIVVAANCTMMHLLLGRDATGLGRYPYQPQFVNTQELLAKEIGIIAGEHTRLYCLPQVSAFIGADIVAGAYVCRLWHEKGNVLFMDIGTNGEMLLSVKGKLYSCSCAAGPALEGMNIRFGMLAAPGAIEDVKISEGGIHLTTIENEEPKGLCGSGILAAIKELLRNDFVKRSGVLLKPEELEQEDYRRAYLRLDGKKREVLLWKGMDSNGEEREILVTQEDIRQVQLAKGALLSGFLALLDKGGIGIEDLDKVIIAGQFGSHLSAESLTEVGIVPKKVWDKLSYVGNSAQSGAYIALLSAEAKKEMEELATRIEYMELADLPDYQDLFMQCMRF